MMKIENVRVYGLEESIVASGFPMLEKPMSEKEFDDAVNDIKCYLGLCKEIDELLDGRKLENNIDFIFDELCVPYEEDRQAILRTYKHYRRVKNLGGAKAGSGHDCFAKGVVIQLNLTASHVFLLQFMRYHFQDTISSMSKMHRILKMDLEEVCNPKVDTRTLDIVREKISEYIADPSAEKFEAVVMNCPLGLELTSRIELNYLQLKSMYAQRKHHKMSEWHIFLDSLLAKIPHFELLHLT